MPLFACVTAKESRKILFKLMNEHSVVLKNLGRYKEALNVLEQTYAQAIDMKFDGVACRAIGNIAGVEVMLAIETAKAASGGQVLQDVREVS